MACTGPLSKTECDDQIQEFEFDATVGLFVSRAARGISNTILKEGTENFGEFCLSARGMLSSASAYRNSTWNP